MCVVVVPSTVKLHVFADRGMIGKTVEMLSADKEQDVSGGTGGERGEDVGIYFLESVLIEKGEARSVGVL